MASTELGRSRLRLRVGGGRASAKEQVLRDCGPITPEQVPCTRDCGPETPSSHPFSVEKGCAFAVKVPQSPGRRSFSGVIDTLFRGKGVHARRFRTSLPGLAVVLRRKFTSISGRKRKGGRNFSRCKQMLAA